MNSRQLKQLIHESIEESLLPHEVLEYIGTYEDDLFNESQNLLYEGLKLEPNEFVISPPNDKISETPSFSILSGWSCPGAKQCLSKVNKNDGKREITTGKDAILRCFAAQLEAQYPEVYEKAVHNFNLARKLKTSTFIAKSLIKSIIKSGIVKDKFRIHVGGDFFSKEYFNAWVKVAKYLKNIEFYAYTKSSNFLPKNASQLPPNLKVTLSMGGRYDKLADELEGYVKAHIVNSKEEADKLGLQIDYDDSLAESGETDFALLIHASQIKGTDQARLVAFYNTLSSLLKKVKVSPKYIKRIKARMTVSEIVNKFFPQLANPIFSRIYRSKLDKYFSNIPSEEEIKDLPDTKINKDTEFHATDKDELERTIDKISNKSGHHIDDDELMAALSKMQ